MTARRPGSSSRRRGKADTRVALFGLGRAGSALLRSLLEARVVVVAVGARRPPPHPLPEGVRALRSLASVLKAASREGAELLFVAVPDDALADLDQRLARATALPQSVAHLSGALGPEALESTSRRAAVASFHPLAALDPARPIPAGTVLGIDASSAVLARRLSALAQRLGLEPAKVTPGAHGPYHLGASVAANLPLALLANACGFLEDAGLDEEAALRAARGLMRSALDNAALRAKSRRDLGAILTGPVARGDLGTVARHLDALKDAPRFGAVYRALSTDLALLAAGLREGERAVLLRVLDGQLEAPASRAAAARGPTAGAKVRRRRSRARSS